VRGEAACDYRYYPCLRASDHYSTVAPNVPGKGEAMPEGYCVKERKKVEIQNPQQVTMKNGRPAIQGTCPDCGTKIFKIGKLEA
jgi:hypothetical protein